MLLTYTPGRFDGWKTLMMTLLWMLVAAATAVAGPDAGAAVPKPDPTSDPSRVAVQHGFDTRWSEVSSPSSGLARSIGLPGAGCVQGAASLPRRAPTYVVVHPERRRDFGHPDLIAYLREVAGAARTLKLGPLYIGDLGQARGGPTPTGHRSHQNGLDVDLWYGPPAQPPVPGKSATPPSVVDLRTGKMLPAWNRRAAGLVELAASRAPVDRIFVHPAVKRALCQDKARRGPWLARVRPWWGHQDHFHVRLRCPTNSPDCTPQPALTGGEGCDASLDWWFSADAKKTAAKRTPPGEGAPAMPAPCEALLGETP
jgi:penicillin-insensitive murein endopeptidase